MSLSGISTAVINKVESISKVDVNSDGSVAGTPYSVGTTSAGAYMAQGGGGPGDAPGGSLVKKMLLGGVVGAGVGFGASFLPIAWITNLGPGGWAAKGIMAAAGAAVGAIGGLALHFIGQRKQNLAMQAQAQATQQQAMQPTNVAQGATLRSGARGPAAKKLQGDLATLGLYSGSRTNTIDSKTTEAIRKYEVMKGVVPTGQATADLRAAVAQDVTLLRQHA